ncbi:uncharacterized protein LOC127079373 isoform X2 [Lathyrus oleraceus]|uniref:uncharacterized protein LOC127079373 isoform X2 n=1 Tax=Pisum sativum TaxID=3888 RepID=UPI0021D264F2|nr:uncharacterized protein LOC127079373 isoform X2 [Pisum sativum]
MPRLEIDSSEKEAGKLSGESRLGEWFWLGFSLQVLLAPMGIIVGYRLMLGLLSSISNRSYSAAGEALFHLVHGSAAGCLENLHCSSCCSLVAGIPHEADCIGLRHASVVYNLEWMCLSWLNGLNEARS